jgi:hypothetical protein
MVIRAHRWLNVVVVVMVCGLLLAAGGAYAQRVPTAEPRAPAAGVKAEKQAKHNVAPEAPAKTKQQKAEAEGKTPRDLENLIAEPSFEGPAQASGLPAGWYGLHAVPRQGYRFELADEGRTGRKSLMIEGKGQYGVAWGEELPIDRTKQYRARGYVRIQGDDQAAADVKLHYYDVNKRYLGQSRVGFVNPRTPGWQLITIRDQVELFPEARFLGIAVAIAGNGKAWFDDIELRAVARQPEPVNHMANGDMEDVAADRPAGYFVAAAEGGTAQCRYQEEKPHSGKRCLALESKAEWAGAGCGWIEIGRHWAFLVSGYVRTHQGKGQIRIVYFDAAGKIIGRTESASVTAKDWQEVKVKTDFAAHPQAVKFSVAAVVDGEGSADFDDFRVVPAPEEQK